MDQPSTTADDAAERLRRRYPPPRVGRTTTTVLVALGTAVALAWLVWAALVQARPAVSAQVPRYQVLSDTRMSVTITVDRPDPSIPVSCRVLAQSTDFQPVGEQEVAVGASAYRVVDTTIELTTLRRATSASVRSCTAG